MSQFRPIGKIAAQLVQQQMRVDLAVGDATATVLVAEGCGQLIWHRGAEGPIAPQAIFNDFLAPGMGDQLRALAGVVDAAAALTAGFAGGVK